MKKFSALTTVTLVALFLLPSVASAGPFYLTTNQLGYHGTISNLTQGTGPWLTADPGERNADRPTLTE